MRSFPNPGKRGPTFRWACKVMQIWREAGYPTLIGAPAEQVRVANAILYGAHTPLGG